MQNQINEARKAAQQPIITWHRDVLGMGMFGGSGRMWNALLTPTSSVTMGIPMTAAGAESLRNIRNLESQYKSLGGSYQGQATNLKTGAERQLQAQSSLLNRMGQRTGFQGEWEYKKAEYDLSSYMNKIMRDFNEAEVNARRQLQSLLGTASVKTGVSHWLNEGGEVSAPGAMQGVDSVLAGLTPGEFVVRQPVVKSLGTEFFEKINRYGLEAFNKGGLVGGQNVPVPETISSAFNATVNINIGDRSYMARMKEFDAKDFVKTLKMAEKRMQ
jgi:hypothetical protein